jgi:hypothetical protein
MKRLVAVVALHAPGKAGVLRGAAPFGGRMKELVFRIFNFKRVCEFQKILNMNGR